MGATPLTHDDPLRREPILVPDVTLPSIASPMGPRLHIPPVDFNRIERSDPHPTFERVVMGAVSFIGKGLNSRTKKPPLKQCQAFVASIDELADGTPLERNTLMKLRGAIPDLSRTGGARDSIGATAAAVFLELPKVVGPWANVKAAEVYSAICEVVAENPDLSASTLRRRAKELSRNVTTLVALRYFATGVDFNERFVRPTWNLVCSDAIGTCRSLVRAGVADRNDTNVREGVFIIHDAINFWTKIATLGVPEWVRAQTVDRNGKGASRSKNHLLGSELPQAIVTAMEKIRVEVVTKWFPLICADLDRENQNPFGPTPPRSNSSVFVPAHPAPSRPEMMKEQTSVVAIKYSDASSNESLAEQVRQVSEQAGRMVVFCKTGEEAIAVSVFLKGENIPGVLTYYPDLDAVDAADVMTTFETKLGQILIAAIRYNDSGAFLPS